MIEVELPDGSIAEFPPDTPRETIETALRETFPPKPERPALATQALHGANEALLAPVRGAESLIAKVIGSEKRPVSQFMERQFYPSKAETPGERIARSGGAMVPDTLMMALMLAGAAPALPAALASRLPSGVGEMLRRSMLYPYSTPTPVATMVGDVAGGFGAGVGSQAYKEIADDPNAAGEFSSGVAGGALSAGVPTAGALYSRVAPLAVAGKVVRNAALANMPDEVIQGIPFLRTMADSRREALRQRELPRVAKEFGGLNQPEMQAGVAQAGALREEVPGFNPSLAEATGLPSAVATQSAIERQASGADLDALARRRALSEEALRRYQQRETPGAPEMPQETIAKAMQRRTEGAREAHVGQTRDLAEKALDLPQQLPQADREAVGGKLRDRMLELRTAESQRMSQLAEEAGLDNKTWLPFSKLQDRIRGVKPSKFAEGESMGKVLQTIMDYKHEAGQPVNFQDIKYLREQLGDEIRTAERAGERNKARILREGRDQIDAFLDDDVPAKVFAGKVGLQGKYKEFRQTYKTDFIDRFETGAGRKAKRIGPDQRYRSADEDVAADFFKPGDVRAARDFHTVFQGDADAAEAMKATILDSARAAAVKDGAIDRRALERWYKAHQSVLDQFPEARDLVKDVGRASENIEARRAQLVARGRAIEDSKFAKAAGGEPDKAVDALLADKRMADRAIRVMDEGEKQAFSRAMWDYALGGKDADPSPDAIRSFLREHGDLARKVMSREHLQALGNLAQGWEMMARVPSAAGKMTETNAMRAMTEAIGTGPLQISSRIFAAASGRTSPRMVMADLLARAGVATSQKEAKAIAREALYDADFARELASYVRNPQSRLGREAVPKMKSYVSALGLKIAQPNEDER